MLRVRLPFPAAGVRQQGVIPGLLRVESNTLEGGFVFSRAVPAWTDMLQPHDLVPHFELTDLRGERIRYSSIWQRQNLVLVTLPGSDPPSRDYAGRLLARAAGPGDDDTAWIATSDSVEGLPPPG